MKLWLTVCADPRTASSIQANTTRWPNAGLMLAQRRRRLANINPALAQRIVFAVIWTLQNQKAVTVYVKSKPLLATFWYRTAVRTRLDSRKWPSMSRYLSTATPHWGMKLNLLKLKGSVFISLQKVSEWVSQGSFVVFSNNFKGF